MQRTAPLLCRRRLWPASSIRSMILSHRLHHPVVASRTNKYHFHSSPGAQLAAMTAASATSTTQQQQQSSDAAKENTTSSNATADSYENTASHPQQQQQQQQQEGKDDGQETKSEIIDRGETETPKNQQEQQEEEEAGPPNVWDRNKRHVYNALIVVVGIFAVIALGYMWLMQDATSFNAYFHNFTKSVRKNEEELLLMAYYALERGLDVFRADRVRYNADMFEDVMQTVFGDWSSGSSSSEQQGGEEPKYDASIRAINPNFMFYVLCAMHLLSRVKQNKIDDRTNTVVGSELVGNRMAFGIKKHYYEAMLDFHFPVVNTRTGAIAVLKVTMRTLPKQPPRQVHTDGEDSKEVYYDLPAFDVESVSLCNPKSFVGEFGSSVFDELPNRTLDNPIVISWPRSMPAEVLIYKRDIVETVDMLESVFPPLLQPDMNSYQGHFVPYHMKEEHLCEE